MGDEGDRTGAVLRDGEALHHGARSGLAPDEGNGRLHASPPLRRDHRVGGARFSRPLGVHVRRSLAAIRARAVPDVHARRGRRDRRADHPGTALHRARPLHLFRDPARVVHDRRSPQGLEVAVRGDVPALRVRQHLERRERDPDPGRARRGCLGDLLDRRRRPAAPQDDAEQGASRCASAGAPLLCLRDSRDRPRGRRDVLGLPTLGDA